MFNLPLTFRFTLLSISEKFDSVLKNEFYHHENIKRIFISKIFHPRIDHKIQLALMDKRCGGNKLKKKFTGLS